LFLNFILKVEKQFTLPSLFGGYNVRQRLKKWHLLLPWLVFIIEGLEQGWLTQCQFKVSDWVVYHVYLWHGTSVYWHLKIRLDFVSVTADLTTTVVHSYTLLRNYAKPDHSRTHYITSYW